MKLFSVMGKLPATSYVRMVDIWLIFGQLYPFIQGENHSLIDKILLFVAGSSAYNYWDACLWRIYQQPWLQKICTRVQQENRRRDTGLTFDKNYSKIILLFQNQQTKIGKWILPEIPSVHKIAKTFGMYGMYIASVQGNKNYKNIIFLREHDCSCLCCPLHPGLLECRSHLLF